MVKARSDLDLVNQTGSTLVSDAGYGMVIDAIFDIVSQMKAR